MGKTGNHMRILPCLILAYCGVSIGIASADLDTFGITRMHPTRSGTREWNSAHWATGTARLVAYDGDAFDPTGWTDNHGSGGDSIYIDGKGTMRLKGAGPRFHINSTAQFSGPGPADKVPPQSFLNVEATGYYRRLTTGGAAYDGAEIQVRTGPLAHGSQGGNACDATGYAARFRDDGNWDFEKELKHPGSGVYSTRSGSGAPLFGAGTIPLNRWFGMKFLVYNLEGGSQVRLELYIDSVSDVGAAAPAGGGHWNLMGAMIHDLRRGGLRVLSFSPDMMPWVGKRHEAKPQTRTASAGLKRRSISGGKRSSVHAPGFRTELGEETGR